MNKEKLQQFNNILAAVQNGVTKTEIQKLYADFLRALQETKNYLENEIKNSDRTVQISYALGDIELRVKKLVQNSEDVSTRQITNFTKKFTDSLNQIKATIPTIPEQQDLTYLEEKIHELESHIIGLEDSPTQTRDKLESLKGDERLDISAIKGIETSHTTLSDAIINRAIGIVDQRTSFLINKVSNLQTQVNNTTSGGIGAILTATGTIDDSNTSFTFIRQPTLLVINGGVYQQTGGAITWTWTQGTLTATISSAVGTGGSIFGL